MGGIFCDLEKAFHYVNHEILLFQLQFYGIPDVAEDWFRCFVRNRRQNVEVTSPNSTRPATSWVHYTTSCNTQSSAPEDGQNNFPKHVKLTGIINKPLLLHLVGCLYYLYQ